MTRVLLVDDDGVLLGALARLLSTAFDVTPASTLGEARAALSLEVPDILLTDLNLGGGERGEVLLQYVAAHHPTILRVVLSGDPDSFAALNASGLAQSFVEKGANKWESIIPALQAAVAARRLEENKSDP